MTYNRSVRSEAMYEVQVEKNVMVEMRDGTRMATDIYLPAQDGRALDRPFPVLLQRTPYDKGAGRMEDAARYFAERGYAVVMQDNRGRYNSEGKFHKYVSDAEDGYDTVQWAANLRGSSGKVGTFGSSYNAFLQWRLAALRPPALVAMAAYSITARLTDLEGPGTIRPGRRLKWWLSSMTPDLRKRANRPGNHTKAAALRQWDTDDGRYWLNFLPWRELPAEVFEDETTPVQHWLKHPNRDPWKLHLDAAQTAVPNFDVIGIAKQHRKWRSAAHIDRLSASPHTEKQPTAVGISDFSPAIA
ncbi:MAG: CocE/NonD family hydrolase [Proteobacteria bacterium]|nr:CocE/NonD family hydrolase [Pseudomonadota bacterium]